MNLRNCYVVSTCCQKMEFIRDQDNVFFMVFTLSHMVDAHTIQFMIAACFSFQSGNSSFSHLSFSVSTDSFFQSFFTPTFCSLTTTAKRLGYYYNVYIRYSSFWLFPTLSVNLEKNSHLLIGPILCSLVEYCRNKNNTSKRGEWAFFPSDFPTVPSCKNKLSTILDPDYSLLSDSPPVDC
jgi:hypothetical protein